MLLGACLLTLALITWRQGSGSMGSRFLGVYLALVGANYFVGGLEAPLRLLGLPAPSTWRIAFVANFLDPGFLLLFALEVAGKRRTWGGVALAAGAALTLTFVVHGGLAAWHRILYTPLIVACYLGAIGLIAWAYFRGSVERRPGLGALVIALAPVALTRLPLAYMDLGLIRDPGDRMQPHTLAIETLHVVVAAGFAAFCWIAARREERKRALAMIQAALSLLILVEVVWALRFSSLTFDLSSPFFFSIRWFLFLTVVVTQTRRGLSLPFLQAPSPALRRLLVTLFVGTSVLIATGFIATGFGLPLVPAVMGGLAIVLLGVGIRRTLRTATTPWDAVAESREAAVFRSRVLLGASDAELDELRGKLRLDRAQAARIRELAALERETSRLAGPEALSPGVLVSGTYRIEAAVGGGAFGRVFRATDVRSGEGVIVKEMRREWHADPLALARFENEVDVLLRVSHPNLVRFLALEPIGRGSALVMARVPGETLRDRLARGPLTSDEARRLATDVLAALSALHARGIVHRDVKPDNVMLTPDGRAVLLDLGSATPPGNGTILGRLGESAGPGTPSYMSPEQQQGRAVGPASDIYSLGLVLREALPRKLPDGWARVLSRATQPSPARRWPSAEAFRDALP